MTFFMLRTAVPTHIIFAFPPDCSWLVNYNQALRCNNCMRTPAVLNAAQWNKDRIKSEPTNLSVHGTAVCVSRFFTGQKLTLSTFSIPPPVSQWPSQKRYISLPFPFLLLFYRNDWRELAVPLIELLMMSQRALRALQLPWHLISRGVCLFFPPFPAFERSV